MTSILEVKICHESLMKKKGKKRMKRRNLVATAAYSLEELLTRQELEHKLEISLQCQTPSERPLANEGKPALLHLQLWPPPSTPLFTDKSTSDLTSDSGSDSGQTTSDTGYAIKLKILRFLEHIIASFTVYRKMEEAAKSILPEEHTKQVLNELQKIEWKYVGGLLVALPAYVSGLS
ncbi:hypothetical protein AX14_004607 [Amanita brunnescens Koide BX004]|nr:hypothetical protein AX14_004607 [Amanita brunnescens Koide BX004]